MGRPIAGTRSAIIEWRGASNKDASVAAVVERDEERKIQGVDIADYSKGALDDDASEAEEDDELDEAETVEEEARANQR